MPIKKTSSSGAGDRSEQKIRKAKKALYGVMQFTGESAVKYARENGNFRDRTGNLRSSEGYSVVEDGKLINESSAVQFFDGKEGVSAGKSLRTELAANYGKGITTIVSAGMDYAHEVEAKGYDVLSGSELRAKQMVPRLLRKLGFKVKLK